jgi:acyl carrier protein
MELNRDGDGYLADSLDMAELVLSLEEEFDIMIDDVEVERTPPLLVQMIVYIEDNING